MPIILEVTVCGNFTIDLERLETNCQKCGFPQFDRFIALDAP